MLDEPMSKKSRDQQDTCQHLYELQQNLPALQFASQKPVLNEVALRQSPP
jgi:hypothetical protein